MSPCQLEVGSTVALMRQKNHDHQSAPYENEGPGAGLVLPIVFVSCALVRNLIDRAAELDQVRRSLINKTISCDDVQLELNSSLNRKPIEAPSDCG